MNDKELYKSAFSHIRASDELRTEVMKMSEKQSRKRIGKKGAATLLIAAALAAALTVTGFATGYIQSVFSGMRNMYVGEDPGKYEDMDRLSNREAETVRGEAATFTLSQSYYDGESLSLAYDLSALTKPADFDFGPGSENFDYLQSVKGEDTELCIPLAEKLTAEEYRRFVDTYNETGAAGVVFYDVYLSDHVRLESGEDVGAFNSTRTENGVYMEFQTPLSDAARDKDELNIVIGLRSSPWYYYQDESGGYYYLDLEHTVTEYLPFTIKRAK